MKVNHFLLLFTTLLLGAFSCSTGPEFERDNINDPEGSDFSPNPPSGENYSINNEGNVLLIWEDNTEHEDSYIIYKSIHTDSSFKKIAVLERNSTQYLDDSGIFGYPTIYKIVSQKEMHESEPIVVTIDLDNFADFSFETDSSTVTMNWNHHFDFGAKLLIKMISVENNSELELGTVKLTENTFKLKRPVDDLYYQFVFTLYFQNESGKSYGSDIIQNIGLNVSSAKAHSFYTENQVRLVLDNKFASGSGYKLYKKDSSGSGYTYVNTFDPNSEFIPIEYAFRREETYTYAITTLLNDMESDLQEYTFKAITPAVELSEITSINQNTVQLTITDSAQLNRIYQIYRATGGNCYADWRIGDKIGEIPIGENTYTDSTLDGNEKSVSDYYCYQVRTKLSEFSNKKRVRYGNTVVLADSAVFSTSNGNFLSTDINTAGNLIAINSSSKISLYNTYDFSSWEINNSGFDQIVRISIDENLILIGNKEGVLKLMDLHSEEVLRNINFESYGEIIDIRFSLLDDAFLILTEQGFYHLLDNGEIKTYLPSLEISNGYIYVGNSNSLILLGAGKNLYRWDFVNNKLNRHNFSLEFNVSSVINHIDYYVSEIYTNYPHQAMVSYVNNAAVDWDIDNGYGSIFEYAFDNNNPLTYRRSIYVPKSDFRFTASDYEYHYQRIYNIYQDLITYHETYPILMEVINLGYLDNSELIAMIKRNDSEAIIHLLEPVRMWRSEDID